MSARLFHQGLIVTLLSLALPQAVSAAGVAPSVVENPGPVSFTLTGGSAKIGSNPEVALSGPSGFNSGRIDADGNISIPAAGVTFAPVQIRTSEITATVRIQATNNVVGQLDPSTGEAGLRIPFRLKIEAPGLPIGSECYVGTSSQPIDVNRALTTNPGGSAYSQASGSMSLAASFSIPGASGCRGFDREVNAKVGSSGSIRLSLRANPIVKSGGKKIEGGVKKIDNKPLPPSAGLVDPPVYPPISLSGGGGSSKKPGSGDTLGGNVEQQPAFGTVRFGSKHSYYDDGTASAFIACHGPIDSVCKGKLRFRPVGKKRKWIGVRGYRIAAGDIAEVNVTIKLAKRTVSRAKAVKLIAVLSPAEGGKPVQKKLLMTFA